MKNNELVTAVTELKEASSIILAVASHTHRPNKITCPHGWIPSFPTHAWWCDECFYRLKDAIEQVEYALGRLEE